MAIRSPRHRAPTIDEVARVSGLSRGTVSRYINGGTNVSARAGKAIQDAIDETGFRVNPHARSLRSQRTRTVAFVLPIEMQRLFADPVFALLVDGCARALSETGTQMVMLLAADDEQRRRAREFVLAGHVDGVIATALPDDESEPFTSWGAAEVPMVICACPPSLTAVASSVASDDSSAGEVAVGLLRELGRTRIAYLGGLPDDNRDLRGESFREAMSDAYDERLDVRGGYAADAAAAATRELLDAGVPFDGLFAANDVSAAAAIEVLTAAGRRVPEDVAVVGFDNVVDVCEASQPTLTTIAQNWDQICHDLVQALNDRMAGGPVTHAALPVTVVRRQSA